MRSSVGRLAADVLPKSSCTAEKPLVIADVVRKQIGKGVLTAEVNGLCSLLITS